MLTEQYINNNIQCSPNSIYNDKFLYNKCSTFIKKNMSNHVAANNTCWNSMTTTLFQQ